MPDAKMTEGQRIAKRWALAYGLNPDELSSDIDAAIARLRGEMLSLGQELTLDSLAAKDAEIERLRDACTKVSAFALRKHGGWTVPAGAVTACDDAIGVRWQDGKLIDKEPTNDHHT